MGTTVGIWAHPDDEVFVSGGLLADAARRGERVVCIYLTNGEAGLSYGQPSSPVALANLRQRELQASLALLGVRERRFFGYPDGCLPLVSRRDVISRIHEALVELQPDEIVTFGSDGFTGHPDHKALSASVRAAMSLCDQPGARLNEVVMSTEWKDAFVPALNEFDAFWPGHPATFDDPDISLRLDDELLDIKVDALRAHASQMKHLFDAYGDRFMRAMASKEHYRVSRVRKGEEAAALSSNSNADMASWDRSASVSYA